MSLVSEALRKARQEAAQREAQERGAVPTAHLAGLRARRGGSVAALVAVGLAAALGGAGLAWWGSSRTGRQAAAAVTPGPATATVAVPTEAPATAPATEPAASAGVPPAAPPRNAPAAVPAAAAEASLALQPARAASSPAPTAQPSTAAAAASNGVRDERADREAATTTGAERSFVLDADLGYARLHLDFIVYKPSAPFGRINGRDIVVGSIIDGFRVEEIAPEWVRLRDAHGAVVLRAH